MNTAPMRIPFNDLSFQWREIASEVRPGMEALFENSAFVLGPHVREFEQAMAGYLGCRHAIGVNSGTSALHLAMLAAGVGPGDAVLVPAHSFIASVWGILYAGATPVLCDVDSGTGTIDLGDAERRLTPAVKAIVPVHLYGQPMDMGAVMQFAGRHELVVIEDAAQAVGAKWDNKRVGTFGQTGCFSFYPGKNLGAAGEGGLIATNDDAVASRVGSLRDHGQKARYVHDQVGFNYRMDGIQGLVLLPKLKRLEAWTERRRLLAARYQEGLVGLPLEVPQVVNQDHVWHLFVVRTKSRDELRQHLTDAGIETGLHYPVPLHRQPCLAPFVSPQDGFPVAERWAAEGLSLPLFTGMTEEQVGHVADAVCAFFR
jgi:dTDP-4-amino-4,6-dideoxygalactose transaminase